MIFSSDNWAGAHPKIAENLVRHAGGFAPAYGNSELDRQVVATFSEVFEREVSVFFVSTGTAANSLSVTACARPGGVTFCHEEAHMIADECGAPEYFSGGGRLCPVPGEYGKMDPAQLATAIARYPAEFLHGGQPAAVSITQSSEIGTIHTLDEIEAVASVCRQNGLPLHMDGARFANALVALGTTPAEMTWKRGVGIVSFGGTKNGCWCAEAIVVLDPDLARHMPFLHKRAAQLFSKSRFVAAQFEAYFAGDLWLESARHANAMAGRIAEAFDTSNRTRLAWPLGANEVFAIMPKRLATELQEKGARFHEWARPRSFKGEIGEDEVLCRFVASFATSDADVDALAGLIR